MKQNKINSQTNSEQIIQSNCSIIDILNKPPYTLPDGKCVCYSETETDQGKGIIIDHKIRSAVQLTQYDIELLDYLLEHVEEDGTIHITGSDLFDRFGRDGTVFDSLHLIDRLELMEKITNTKTKKTAYHRFRVIASPVSDGQDIKDETEISIRLYDRFVSRFINHAIPDCQISVDYVALGQEGLIGEMAKEFVDDARAKIEQDKEERPAEENEDEREEEEKEEEEDDGNDEENNDAGDTNESAEKENSQNKNNDTENIDILISVRQLNRMFNDVHNDDDFYMFEDGYLVKYRGQGKEDVVIPNGAFLIGNSAFEGSSGLKSVKIPNTVKIICKDAFKDCVNLEEVEMPLSMLQLLMSDIDFCFSGTPIAEMLKKKGLVLQKYKVEIKAKRIEAEDMEEKEEENENDKDESEEGNMDGDENENDNEKDDNGGGASTEKP